MLKKEKINEEAEKTKTEEKGTRAKEKHSERPVEPEVLTKHGYKVMGRVGKGSFADVRMAFSSSQKKNIAVKIIPKHKITDKEFIRRFIPREIRVLRKINHPNIIKFYRSIETVKTIYIFMELVENGDLLQVIKREKMIDERRACRWFHHIVEGLAYLHSKGIVHRDLKCENLLLDKYNIIKLTDFGFTRDEMPAYLMGDKENKERETVLSSTFCGSFAYASPEVLLGKPYEPNMSDVWSIGVVLYITVHGRLPFDDTDWNGLLKQVREAVVFPTTPQVSDSCKRLIKGILAPLETRWYIPKIREDEWYNNMWDSKHESLYQRKYQLETEEEEYRKRLDHTAYKGRRKDITKYERAATLRRYISEKERLRLIKAQLEEEEIKLRKIHENEHHDSEKVNILNTNKSIQQCQTSVDKQRPVNSKTNEQEFQEFADKYPKNRSSEEIKVIEYSASNAHSLKSMESAKHSFEDTFPCEHIVHTSVSLKMNDVGQVPTSIKSNITTHEQEEVLDINKAVEQKSAVGKGNNDSKEQLQMSDCSLSDVDIPFLKIMKSAERKERISVKDDEKAEKDRSIKHFKDISEAILEHNKPTQQCHSLIKSNSRAKEISSLRFYRKSNQGTSSQSEDIQKERLSELWVKEHLKDTGGKTSVGEIKLLGSEDDENSETDLIIENFEMPEKLDEGEYREVELSIHGSLSNISLTQLIRDIENDIKQEESNDESLDLVSHYKQILEEDLQTLKKTSKQDTGQVS